MTISTKEVDKLLSVLPMQIVKQKALKHGLDFRIIAAIAWRESAGNPWAMRYEPQYKWLYKEEALAKKCGCSLETMINMQKSSWGLMQVMGAVAYENGFPQNEWVTKLMVPSESLEFGCRLLSKLWDREKEAVRMVASYNAGSVRFDASTRQLVNIRYVDFVMKLASLIPA